jgi:hypothetical protein
VVGFDEYAAEAYEMGIDETINIPISIEEIKTVFAEVSLNKIEANVMGLPGKNIRILMQQFGDDGLARRSWGGAPPDGRKMDEYLKIEVTQDQKPILCHIEYDKMIWCGLSWGAAEINQKDYDINKPLTIRCSSIENYKLTLRAKIFATKYN